MRLKLTAGWAKPVLLAATALATCAGLGFAPAAHAQDYTTGDLTGRVETDGGQPVAGATVVVRSAQGQTREARTGEDGTYRIPALAAGDYSAEISAPGLSGLRGQRLNVRPGGSAFAFTLPRGATAGELVVTARARRTPDFNRTDVGLSVDDLPALISRVPLANEVNAVTLLTPGVSQADPTIIDANRRPGQNLVSVAGSSAGEQVYYVNGLNVTDQRTFLGFAGVPFEAIQSIDVKSGGYQAEFGRATGGVINIVTRSGSNEFHAGASLYYAPNAWRARAKDAYNMSGLLGGRTLNSAQKASSLDTNVWLSGPLWRDRLFFFGLINPRSDKAEGPIVTTGVTGAAAQTGSQARTSTDTPRWMTKLDFNITDTQRLEATLFSDAAKLKTTNYQWSQAGGFTSPTTITSKSGGLNQIYRYTGTWTNWFTLSALYGRVESQYTDASPSFGTPLVLSYIPNPFAPQYLTAVTQQNPVDLNGKDVRDTYRVDGDFYFNLFGDHHLRVGYDDEELKATDQKTFSGGYQAFLVNTLFQPIPSPPPAGQAPYSGNYAAVFRTNTGGEFKASQSAMYLQDSWRLSRDLTLQLGVRNDRYDYKTASGESFIKTDDQWAPRVGLTWDPLGQGKDKVYASFGRYYLPIAENTAIREAASAPSSVSFHQLVFDASGALVRNPDGSPVLGPQVAQTVVTTGTQAPSASLIASANLEPMYSDEYIVGYEHTFADTGRSWLDGLKVGVAYRDRSLGQTIEDTQLENNGVGPFYNYCARTGTSCLNAAAYTAQYTLFNPGRPVIVMADLAGTGAPQRIELTNADLGNMPEAKNHYQALEFTFERPFDGRWSLGGSYVLARSRGNYEGVVKSDTGQADAAITQDFDHAYFMWGANGYLPNDRRHTIKLYGGYALTQNLFVGMNFIAQSGRKFGCIGYVGDASVEPVPSVSPAAWYCPLGAATGTGTFAVVPTPRGSLFETPWTTQVDLKVAYTFATPDAFGRARVQLDVFNLFNSQAETRIVERGVVQGQPDIPLATFGLPRTYQAPRYIRFGVSYEY